MLRMPLSYYGYTGLHRFAKNLKRWKAYFSDELRGYILLWFYRLIETAGTGGAGYRYIYSDFLKEAATVFQNEVLDDCSTLMNKDADTWRQFSLDCRRYMKSENVTLNEMADILETIGQQESIPVMPSVSKSCPIIFASLGDVNTIPKISADTATP